MTMTPGRRTFALAAHVTASVGWLGAVAAHLALAAAGPTSRHAQMGRAPYLAMEVTARFVIVPLRLASLLTGLVSSLGTTRGLFRHSWVLCKLLLNILATTVSLLYLPSISSFAGVAAETTLSSADLGELRNPTHLVHTGGGLLVLLVATTLSVYKPRGRIRYGRRKQHKLRTVPQP